MRSHYLASTLGGLLDGELRFAPQGIGIELSLSMTTLGDVFEIGPTHHLIGHIRGKEAIGAFTFDRADPGDVLLYPAMWSVDADIQRRLIVGPTHDGEPVRGRDQKVQNMLRKKGNVFISRNFRMTFQSLAVARTSISSMGGNSWTVLLNSSSSISQALVLWCNSILGLLIHSGYGQNTHPGRSLLKIKALSGLPIPDFSADTAAGERARMVADREFERLSELELRPASYAWNDPSRHQIDGAVLEMLGMDTPAARSALDQIRRLWCREPSVHGGNRRIMRELGIDA